MADVPKEVEAIAKQMWGMVQRVGMQVAEKPLEQREAAFAITERALKETAKEMGIAGEQSERLIAVQMRYIRDMVGKIDAGGSPQGGNA